MGQNDGGETAWSYGKRSDVSKPRWQCNMCGLTYRGRKKYPQCGTGIYSREE
ncbi:TPA: zinc-ribbon domain-containing protein [Enterobacter cloacae]|uniref:zinc-ribbon domain-containing protein n=2 Tax=Enterobacter cloacae TaxID=550 RepID=UPI0021CFD9B0|nr:zinc-ribbon domain-containing protein [Enterobacter cloacae]MDR9930979.1 zinc-ribbon domain-containing protein [Enterobacter cloacae subsp. dissolvens]